MKILILNVHSALNLGDAAIMQATIDDLARVFPGSEITVAANDPESWHIFPQLRVEGSIMTWVTERSSARWRFSKLRAAGGSAMLLLAGLAKRLAGRYIFWGSQAKRRLLKAYYEADLIFSCGGGNLYSNKNFGGVFLWGLFSIYFAQMLGKRVLFLPQSIGPIPGRFQRWAARQVFNRAEKVYVRDLPSQELLNEIGVKESPERVPDLAFHFEPVRPGLKVLPREIRVGVNVLDRGQQVSGFEQQSVYEDMIVQMLCHLTRTYHAKISVIVQCFGPSAQDDDRDVSRRIFSKIGCENDAVQLLDTYRHPRDVKQAYANMDLVIASRMHAAILSLNSGVPVILIGYQPKARGLMKQFGMEEFVLPIEKTDMENSIARIDQVMANWGQIRAEIEERSAALSGQLDEWLEEKISPLSL